MSKNPLNHSMSKYLDSFRSAMCDLFLHIIYISHCSCVIILHPHLSLPSSFLNCLSAAAPSQTTVLGRRKVLVDGTAVRNEAQTQLKVTSKPAVCSQSQNQEWSQQQETNNQQSHTTTISQQVWTVRGRAVWMHLKRECLLNCEHIIHVPPLLIDILFITPHCVLNSLSFILAGFVWYHSLKCCVNDFWGVLKMSGGMHVGITEEVAGEMKCLWRNVSLMCELTKSRYTRQECLNTFI